MQDVPTHAFGALGNIFSCLVFLAPVPTFYGICTKRGTGRIRPYPYLVALLSASLWAYYALLKGGSKLGCTILYLLTINVFGLAVEAIYIIVFITYANRRDKILTTTLSLLNVAIFCCILFPTLFIPGLDHQHRLRVLGWICSASAVAVCAAPLCTVYEVIKSWNPESMPFLLSFFITLSAIMWFTYGLIIKDNFVAYPNVLGMTFGLIQMILYGICKKEKCIIIILTNQQIDDNQVTNSPKLGNVVGSSAICPVGDFNDIDAVKEDAKIPNDHKADECAV